MSATGARKASMSGRAGIPTVPSSTNSPKRSQPQCARRPGRPKTLPPHTYRPAVEEIVHTSSNIRIYYKENASHSRLSSRADIDGLVFGRSGLAIGTAAGEARLVHARIQIRAESPDLP